VAAAFELSYRQLDEDAARLFRLLPAGPGPDVSTQAAAELAGWPGERTRAAIGRLTRAHLVEAAGARGRWRMHDLLRLYARQVPDASPGEREQAVDRLLAWYLRRAQAADKHLRALTGAPVPAEFSGRDDALAWLDAQRPNLVAAVTMAAATGRNKEAMLLPLTLSEYLAWRRRFDDWLTVIAVSRDNAHQLNNKGNEAAALTTLGNALEEVRRFDEAISAHQDAAAIYRETGDRHGEGMALNNLGLALGQVRRFEEAISAHQDAAAIYQETGDRHGEGTALNNLGLALLEVRRFEEAIVCYEQDIAICRETGDRYGEGQTLDNLGNAYQEMGESGSAAARWREAAAAMRDAGDHEEAARLEQKAANAHTGQRP
jgi:tetratricopeptide (TPR) repeat protein